MIEGGDAACEGGGLGYRLAGTGPAPTSVIEEEGKDYCIATLQRCLPRGHYLHPNHTMFLTLSLIEQDIQDTFAADQDSIADLE